MACAFWCRASLRSTSLSLRTPRAGAAPVPTPPAPTALVHQTNPLARCSHAHNSYAAHAVRTFGTRSWRRGGGSRVEHTETDDEIQMPPANPSHEHLRTGKLAKARAAAGRADEDDDLPPDLWRPGKQGDVEIRMDDPRTIDGFLKDWIEPTDVPVYPEKPPDMSEEMWEKVRSPMYKGATPEEIGMEKDEPTCQALIFPGQGKMQELSWFPTLLKSHEELNFIMDEMDEALGFKLSDRLRNPGNYKEELRKTDLIQPMHVAYSVLLLKAMELGSDVRVQRLGDVFLGHSLGEYVALYAAGCMSFVEVLSLARARGMLMQQVVDTLPEEAGMLPLECTKEMAYHIASVTEKELGTPVRVAAENHAKQFVVSGLKSALESIRKRAGQGFKLPNQQQMFSYRAGRMLPVRVPFHSPLLTEMVEPFAELVHAVNFDDPQTHVVSCITHNVVKNRLEVPKLLVDHVLRPVRWGRAVHVAAYLGATEFIEIGFGGGVLSAMGNTVIDDLSADITYHYVQKHGADVIKEAVGTDPQKVADVPLSKMTGGQVNDNIRFTHLSDMDFLEEITQITAMERMENTHTEQYTSPGSGDRPLTNVDPDVAAEEFEKLQTGAGEEAGYTQVGVRNAITALDAETQQEVDLDSLQAGLEDEDAGMLEALRAHTEQVDKKNAQGSSGASSTKKKGVSPGKRRRQQK